MSASPKTALDDGGNEFTLTPASLRSAPPATSSGEALQALLAFSALHQQIRQRRVHESDDVVSNPAARWRLEHFVLDEVLQLVAARALAITGADGRAIPECVCILDEFKQLGQLFDWFASGCPMIRDRKAALRAVAMWEKGREVVWHDYLTRKGIEARGLREDTTP